VKKLVALLALGLVVAVGAASAAQTASHKIKATLNVGQEVPKPVGKLTGAGGTFTATMTDAGKITWKLTFKGLSGKAMAAHIHIAKVGKPGPVVLPLCGPCTSGQSGSGSVTKAQVKQIEAHGAYVNVHTAQNAGGEIRGQITAG
jgi:hypothetical protein